MNYYYVLIVLSMVGLFDKRNSLIIILLRLNIIIDKFL